MTGELRGVLIVAVSKAPWLIPIVFVLVVVGIIVNKTGAGDGASEPPASSPPRRSSSEALATCESDRSDLEYELRRVRSELADKESEIRRLRSDLDDAESKLRWRD